MDRERRLVFGEVAELYDEYRPSYPSRLVEDLVEMAELDGARPVLEVGAGTGKATCMFAARGIPVTAVEPSAAMAAVARRACADHPGVLIEVDDFENWDASGRTFPLVFAAQSWHWVQAPVGFAKAARVLTTRGLLAAFWNRPAWPEARAREALAAAYRQAAPLLDAADDPMHPDYRFEVGDEDWVEPVARTDGLSEPEVRCYPSMQMYSSDAYVRLLTTHSAVRLMPDGHRTALLDAVACAIALQGGTIELPLRTRLCLARRCET